VSVGKNGIAAFQITQDYCGAVIVESVAVTGAPEFSLIVQDAGAGFSSSASAVSFAPTGPGPYGGLLIVTTSSARVPVLEVSLSGTGVP
jgi:hypothetical protein